MVMQHKASSNQTAKRYTSSSLMMKPYVLKLIHLGLLQAFSPEIVCQFWKRYQSSIEFLGYSSESYFDAVMHAKAKFPLEFVLKVQLELEPFLVEHNHSFIDFVNGLYTLKANHSGTIVPYRILARIWSPYIKPIMTTEDFRHLFLRSMQWTCKLLSKSSHINFVKQSSNNGVVSEFILFSNDTSFQEALPPFDSEVWVGSRLKSLPKIVGLPEFDTLKIVCDSRDIHQIVPENMIVESNNKTITIGDSTGEMVPFKKIILQHDVCLKAYPVTTDIDVVVMKEDYFCPLRNRIVLHQGCAYGSPVHLFQLDYTQSVYHEPEKIISFVAKRIATEQRQADAQYNLHKEFVNHCIAEYSFYYDSKKEIMFVNGHYLTRHVPAKILRKILVEFQHNGTMKFERKWLLMDEEVVLDRSNPNLEKRIALLQSALNRLGLSFCLTRPSKGVICFNPGKTISFSQK